MDHFFVKNMKKREKNDDFRAKMAKNDPQNTVFRPFWSNSLDSMCISVEQK